MSRAIRLARERSPSLILMDAAMPGLDGWAATAAIKADPELKGIPVVILTAHAFQEHRERAAQVGADLFLPKPILPDELIAAERPLLPVLLT